MQARNFIPLSIFMLALGVAAPHARAQSSRGTVVEIDSDPQGASVYIDDSPFGATPLRLQAKIKPGRHLLRLELDGHEKYEKIVDVSSVARLNVKLTPVENPDENKPLSLERKSGISHIPAPLPGVAKPEREKPEQTKPDASPGIAERQTALPEDAGKSDDGKIPLNKTWVLGVGFGTSDATVDHALSSDYMALLVTVQRQIFPRVALMGGFGIDLQTALDPRPGADPDERGSLRGFELQIGLPVYALDIGGHSLYVAPEAGLTNHGYKYNDFDINGVLVETASFRYIQTRVAASVGYQYLPYDKFGGSVGLGIKGTLQSFSSVGAIPGNLAFVASGSLLVRF